MDFSKEELKFLHCFIGGCDEYLIKHAMSLNEDYTDKEKEEFVNISIKVYNKIQREIDSN